jgi:hypothetical protein
MVRVCIAAGIFGYLREKQREDFFLGFLARMREVGVAWDAFSKHGGLLRTFQDCGGLIQCPASVRCDIVNWMVLTYIGTQGGTTRWGNVRHVFYSNTAAPLMTSGMHTSSSRSSGFAVINTLHVASRNSSILLNPQINELLQMAATATRVSVSIVLTHA